MLGSANPLHNPLGSLRILSSAPDSAGAYAYWVPLRTPLGRLRILGSAPDSAGGAYVYWVPLEPRWGA